MIKMIYAVRLWEKGKLYTDTSCLLTIDCMDFEHFGQGPMNVWLIPDSSCGGAYDYMLQTSVPDPMPLYTLQGVWIPNGDEGIVLNALSVKAVVDACQLCCGTVVTGEMGILAQDYSITVPVRYEVVPPVRPAPVLKEYYIARIDNGDSQAYSKAMMDYYGQYQIASFRLINHDPNTGITTYYFKSYDEPAMIGEDFIENDQFVYYSNDADEKQNWQQYYFTLSVHGDELSPQVVWWRLSQMVDQIQDNPAYTAYGDYSLNGENIRLQSQTPPPIIMTLEAGPGLMFTSNAAPALSAGQSYSLPVTVDGSSLGVPVIAATIPALVIAANAKTAYNEVGRYTQNSDKVVLELGGGATATIEISTVNTPVFTSNTAPSKQTSELFTLTVIADGDTLAPVLSGITLAAIVSAAGVQSPYAAIGTWALVGNTITLTSASVTTATLTIGVIAGPVLQSNSAPSKSNTEYFRAALTGTDGSGNPVNINQSSSSLSLLLSKLIANDAIYGTWAISVDKITLQTGVVTGGAIVITAIAAPSFESNSAPAYTVNKRMELAVVPVSPSGSGTDLDATTSDQFVPLAVDDPTLQNYGTWSVLSGVVKVQSGIFDELSLTLQAITGFTAVSGNPGTPGGGQVYSIVVQIGATVIASRMIGTTLTELVSRMNATAVFNTYGTYTVNGSTVQVESATHSDITLTLSLATAPANTVTSGVPTAPGAGQILFGHVALSGVPQTPSIPGKNVQMMADQMNMISPYKEVGFYYVDSGSLNVLTDTGSVTFSIATQNSSDVAYASNDAPSLSATQVYAVRINANDVVLTDTGGYLTLTPIVNLLNGVSPYNTYGTWQVVGSKIQLTSNSIRSNGAPVIIAVNVV